MKNLNEYVNKINIAFIEKMEELQTQMGNTKEEMDKKNKIQNK